jgi:hypothetical protein
MTTTITAQPSDDLNILAGKANVLYLLPTTYILNKPLVITRPIQIIGGGANLVFLPNNPSQPYTATIKILSSNVSLNDFNISFDSVINWNNQVSYGPAIIGVRDNYDTDTSPANLINITLDHLNIKSPRSSNLSISQECPRSLRLVGSTNSTVRHCTIKGGTVEFSGDHWTITDNKYYGPPSGFYSWCAFGGHFTESLNLSRNLVEAVGFGKVWRFLVLTNQGRNDTISSNIVSNVGRTLFEADTNSNEIILTEAYRIYQEGTIKQISPSGDVITISPLVTSDDTVSAGCIISLLTGVNAGQWRTIVGVQGDNYTLDKPFINVNGHIGSIGKGFVNQIYQNNTIDATATLSSPLVLVGNHYGTQILDNYFVGGLGFKITACPTEHPIEWGWTRAPMQMLRIVNNKVINNLTIGQLGTEAGIAKFPTNPDRTYLNANMRANTSYNNIFFRLPPGSAASSNKINLY